MRWSSRDVVSSSIAGVSRARAIDLMARAGPSSARAIDLWSNAVSYL